MNPVSYLEQAYIFLQQADEELARGDLRQASEKAWGAAAQAVKAAGEARGWEHATHGRLFDVVRRLAEEANDDGLRDSFRLANRLHQNFYEGRLESLEVADVMSTVKEFVAAIGLILALE